jgi:hypothetical protein
MKESMRMRTLFKVGPYTFSCTVVPGCLRVK